MNSYPEETLLTRLEIEVVSASPSLVVLRMPVAGNTQIHGVLHGGASAALAETAASMAASEYAQTISSGALIAVGTELSMSHIRPATGGFVTARTVAEHLGRSRTVHRVVIENEDGKIISSALVSNQLIAARQN
ncbi:MAG: PaaI family thioesterase [Actinomycetaceae bacterium]|nr:PaaI family thioesterase [Actinomycetaceae bacterium]